MEKGKKNLFEINICADYLNRPYENICETLLHEMVHLYNAQNGVNDTCRAGTYHNLKFKKVAEEHGLLVTKNAKSGFCVTELSIAAKSFIADLPHTAFDVYREKNGSQNQEKAKQSMRKYVCPT